MARRRAAILAAISHSAEQLMEHEDLEEGLPDVLLRLDVTEQAMMEDYRFAVVMKEELCRLGIHLYIDDFGSGYSSLGHLIRSQSVP